MPTAPHVPLPTGDYVVAAVFALVVGGVAALVVALAAPGLRARFRRAPSIAAVVIAICTFAIVIQTRATDRLFGGYFSYKTPVERLRDHFADFEARVVKDPEIATAIGQFPDASAMLQSLAARGLPRLDDSTLVHRSRLMAALLSQLGDRACASLHGGTPPSEMEQREVEQAMVKLESGFTSEWMQVLHQQMLAEVRKSPVPELSSEDLNAAYRALEAKIGVDAARRVAAGLEDGASDSERCWSVKSIYEVAPTLAKPHGTVLLRMLARST
jgi:hypothetical protein